VHLNLKGEAIHDCRSCQTAPALYQALRDTILAMPDQRLETERKLASTKRRLAELREELGKPFEHEDWLAALLGRRRALAADLDLGKDEDGTLGLEASEESLAARCRRSGPIKSAVRPLLFVSTRWCRRYGRHQHRRCRTIIWSKQVR
jgi:hypothetical protein